MLIFNIYHIHTNSRVLRQHFQAVKNSVALTLRSYIVTKTTNRHVFLTIAVHSCIFTFLRTWNMETRKLVRSNSNKKKTT